ncbi:MAG: hypothetical protein H7256_14460 [Bdellovibrio sp.]|nr:hypothetical protein [Bdellovibrio sp.]
MKAVNDFAQILEFFEDENVPVDMTSTPSHSMAASINAGWETVLDPAGLAYLMGQTSIYTNKSTNPYNKFKRSTNRPAQTQPVPARATHTFNDEQALAFADITQWAPQLPINFNHKELKTSYRLALLKTHPDQGGSSENFWSVKKSYEVLCSLAKS